MIKTGDKKNFIFMPGVGFIEAGNDTRDAIVRITKAEAKQEMEKKKIIRKVRRLYPNQPVMIMKVKNKWHVDTL